MRELVFLIIGIFVVAGCAERSERRACLGNENYTAKVPLSCDRWGSDAKLTRTKVEGTTASELKLKIGKIEDKRTDQTNIGNWKWLSGFGYVKCKFILDEDKAFNNVLVRDIIKQFTLSNYEVVENNDENMVLSYLS